MYISLLNFNNLYFWLLSRNLPSNGFGYVEDIIFTPEFIINYDENKILVIG